MKIWILGDATFELGGVDNIEHNMVEIECANGKRFLVLAENGELKIRSRDDVDMHVMGVASDKVSCRDLGLHFIVKLT